MTSNQLGIIPKEGDGNPTPGKPGGNGTFGVPTEPIVPSAEFWEKRDGDEFSEWLRNSERGLPDPVPASSPRLHRRMK